VQRELWLLTNLNDKKRFGKLHKPKAPSGEIMNKSRFPRRGELCSPENACFTHILGGRTQFAPTKKQLIIVSSEGGFGLIRFVYFANSNSISKLCQQAGLPCAKGAFLYNLQIHLSKPALFIRTILLYAKDECSQRR